MTHRILTVAVLTLCTVIAADERQVNTSREKGRLLPLPKEEGSFHFVIYGDRTGGPAEGVKILARAVEDTNLLGPDLVLTVGDLVEGYCEAEPWMTQMKEYRGIMNRLDMPWFPVAGNHDIYWRGPNRPPGEHEGRYEKHFGPLWYWFRHKNAGFLVLYTDEGDGTNRPKSYHEPKMVQMSEKQLAWLGESLKKMKELDQVFVFLHHPRWRSHYRGTNWPAVHDLLAKAGNVTAVFAGHIHRVTYDGKKDGIEYFTLAGTGSGIGPAIAGGGWLHHMNVVTVRKDSYTVATIPIGQVMDPRQFTSEWLADVDRARGVAAKVSGGPLRVDSDGKSYGRYVARVDNPCSRPLEVTFLPKGDDGSWHFSPDHVHLEVPPGGSKDVEIAYLRRVGDFSSAKAPRLESSIDYLADGLRVTLPAKSRPIPLALGQVLPAFFEGATEQALEVGGKGKAVRVESRSIPLADGPFTLEAWTRFRDTAADQSIAGKIESSEFGLKLESGKPSFLVHLAGKYVKVQGAAELVQKDRWHHIAGVFDGSEMRLYVDGALAGKTAAKGARKRNSLPFYVGADPDGGGKPVKPMQGRIDDVRISSTARYAAGSFTPARAHAPDDSTVLLLPLDGALGEFVPDRSKNGAHGRLQGGAKLVRLKEGESKTPRAP